MRRCIPFALLLVLLTLVGCTSDPAESSGATPTTVGPDPDFAGCQQGCGFNEPYDPEDVVSQPGARVGDLTRCPVSDAVFVVRDDQRTVEHAGVTYYVCCDECANRFREEPSRFAVPRS